MFEDRQGREARRRRRIRFDSVADLYDAVRPAYPSSLVDRIFELSGLGSGGRVLEVGCGTGQLTQDLARDGVQITAIDPGPELIALARRRVTGDVSFFVTTFEEVPVHDASFDLVVSASAFHWTDPEIRWSHAAELLRDGGWLMVIDTVLDHEEPLATTMRQLWIEHSSDGGAWASDPPPPMVDQLRDSGLFGAPIAEVRASPAELDPDTLIALGQTSAAFLSYTDHQKVSYTTKLTEALAGQDKVRVHLGASLLAARRR